MGNEDKNNTEWKPLQAIRTNFSINDIIKPEFLDIIEKSFDTKHVDVINLAIYITDKNDSDKEVDKELITVAHKTTRDTNEKRVIVDVNNSKSFEKIQKAFDSYSS